MRNREIISEAMGFTQPAQRQIADPRPKLEKEACISLRRHVLVALAVVVLLVCGLGAAAVQFEINGAVIAPGKIVVESNTKRVQHREGGIVQQILVKEGDQVEAGALLVRLDDTVPRTNLAVITSRLQELLAQEARLIAERDGQAALTVPEALQPRRDEAEVAAVLAGQRSLLEARQMSRQTHTAQLAEQIKQYEDQITGFAAQRQAKAEEMRLLTQDLKAFSQLLQKGLIQKSKVTNLRRDKARLEGDVAGFTAQIAQAAQAISEREIQILQIDDDMRAEVVEQLQAVRAEIAELTEREVAAREELLRVAIRAPRAGLVHHLNVHTVGGVVAAGEDLMLIVPQEDLLQIEAQVNPTDVDQLALAQEAIVRFPGLDQRTTPELSAQILTLSPDLSEDPATGIPYYRVRLTLDENEVAKLGNKRLIPGMPAEAFVQTGTRNILSYLVKPLADQIAHAFREG